MCLAVPSWTCTTSTGLTISFSFPCCNKQPSARKNVSSGPPRFADELGRSDCRRFVCGDDDQVLEEAALSHHVRRDIDRALSARRVTEQFGEPLRRSAHT